MKRASLFVLSLVLLSGCGASRRTMKSDTMTTREAQAAAHAGLESSVKERMATQTEQFRDEEVTTVVVEYDTSRPVDSSSGTPPVQRTIRQTRRTTTTARQDAQTDTKATAKATADEASAEKEQTTVQAEEHTRRGLNGWQQILCYAGAAAILGLVVWLAGRRLKRRLNSIQNVKNYGKTEGYRRENRRKGRSS